MPAHCSRPALRPERYKADQALLAAWVGMNKRARREISTEAEFRVWNGATLMSEPFFAYDELPLDAKVKIPLRPVLALDGHTLA